MPSRCCVKRKQRLSFKLNYNANKNHKETMVVRLEVVAVSQQPTTDVFALSPPSRWFPWPTKAPMGGQTNLVSIHSSSSQSTQSGKWEMICWRKEPTLGHDSGGFDPDQRGISTGSKEYRPLPFSSSDDIYYRWRWWLPVRTGASGSVLVVGVSRSCDRNKKI